MKKVKSGVERRRKSGDVLQEMRMEKMLAGKR